MKKIHKTNLASALGGIIFLFIKNERLRIEKKIERIVSSFLVA